MVNPILFILKFFFDFWWLFLPLFIFQITWEKFTDNQKSDFRKKMKWAFLEIKFPTNITRTPRAMEEVFNSLHAIHPDVKKDLTWYNLNIGGFTPKSYTLLIIAHNSKLRFFIRFPQELKEFIKTRFYAQYPDVQFIETDDPLKFLPPNLPNTLFEFEAFNVKLTKADVYPIKTYSFIENLPKEQQIDPISIFSEGAYQISNKEWLIFQIFILPTTADNEVHGEKWIERGKKEVNKLIGKEEKKAKTLGESIIGFIGDIILAFFTSPTTTTQPTQEKKEEFNIQKLTPGDREILEAIQRKISKFGYVCSLRISYIAEKNIFASNKSNVFALISSIFKNFSTENLNSFSLTPLTKAETHTNLKIFHLKRIQYIFFKIYRLPDRKGFVLNSEELATIFHPPMGFVPPSGIERIPLKEISPPEIPQI